MADTVIYTRASPAAIARALSRIPEMMRSGGRAADTTMRQCGLAALTKIHEAFLAKSKGGTDEANERWQPLSPAYVAYRRAKRTRAEKRRDSYPSQALNARQQARWWVLYHQGIDRGQTKSSAAKRAWAIIKEEGATTLFDKYSGSAVDILRDTGLLLRSLTPGVKSSASVFRVGPGMVTIGTSRPHAGAHHRGVPGRLPQRRLWPAVGKWPSSWWAVILAEVQRGVLEAIGRTMRDV